MNEQQLSDRMAELVGDQPAMRQTSTDDLRRGRRRVALRRGATVAGAAGLVAATVVGVPQVGWPDGGEAPVASLGPDATSGSVDPLVTRCADTDGGTLDPDIFGPGSRVLTKDADAGGDVSAVIVSTDGRAWASCQLFAGADREFDGAVMTYPMRPAEQHRSGMETNSMGFGNERFSYIDRFPADVKRVTVEVIDGTVVSAPAVQGFVAFQRVVPGLTMAASPSFDVTLYGADGEVLADKSMAEGDASLPVEYRTLVPSDVGGVTEAR